MWTMGYSDGGENIYSPTTTTTTATNNESFSGSRKLRPLIPRPPSSQPQPQSQPQPHPHQHHGRGGADHFLVLNHHLATMAEQSKREFNNAAAQQVVVSSRWNPTPEQLGTLEDLWRRGTRTPSADEIQQITSRLRRYGKIEGKNVFYWFQNHKARERQKRRRQMESGGCPDEENDHGGGLNELPESGNLGNKEADTGGRCSKTSSEDVRRSNNSSSNSNWESATDKEGKLMASVGGGGSGRASLFVDASGSSSSSAVRSPLLWMKKSSDNNSVPAGESLLHSPNSNVFCLSDCCCCCDDNDGNANFNNVPLEWQNAAWHHHPSSAPLPCRPLLLPPFPRKAGHLTTRAHPDTTASRSSSPTSSSPLTNPDFTTLQLFPLHSSCDQEEDYLEGFGGGQRENPLDIETGMEEFDCADHVDHHQFFEFLPLKN